MVHCKTILSVFVSGVLFSGISAANSFPHGCELSGFGFSENHLILNDNGAQTFYLIQNRGTQTIELQRHETREVFMSPPLSAKIDASNWSAFASDVENLNFQCFITTDDIAKKVSCRDVLEVCQYPRVKFALSNMGNYWVSVNKTQTEVINEAVNKGILLRW